MQKDLGKELSALMQQAQKGDKAAYKAVLQQLEKLALGYIRKRINSADKVDDIVQEILISVHKSKHTYNPDNPLLPWFYAISSFRLKDYLRKFYNNKEDISFEESFEAIIPAEGAFGEVEKQQIIQKALSILSDKNRRVVELMYIEGFSVKEVAQKMDISESDAKVSAHRALKEIKSKFGN